MNDASQYSPIIIGLMGTILQDSEKKILAHPFIGGVILFACNFSSKEQIKRLIEDCQNIRGQHNLPALIMTIDHEGGVVQRLNSKEFTLLPSASSIGKLFVSEPYSAMELMKNIAVVTAYELGSLGIDMCYGPVLDFNHDKKDLRHYSTDKETISILTDAYISQLQEAGLYCSPKHFPGLGGDNSDSHFKIGISEKDFTQLLDQDLYPYINLIQNNKIKAIMLSHRVFVEVDHKLLCISSVWLKNILRKQLGFNGVVISDCMQMMGALAITGNFSQKCAQVISAGCDYLLISRPYIDKHDNLSSLLNSSEFQKIVENSECVPESLYRKYTNEYFVAKLNESSYQNAKEKITQSLNRASRTAKNNKKTPNIKYRLKKLLKPLVNKILINNDKLIQQVVKMEYLTRLNLFFFKNRFSKIYKD